jgi:alcohol dehydrogenase (NADP+)
VAFQCSGTSFQIFWRQLNKICEIVMTTQFSPELRGQYKAKAYAAANAKSPLVPFMIPRRNPGEHDVQIEILFCGICHSDLHQVRNEWSTVPTVYPCVPGHEIVGRVTKVGSAVTKFKPGDHAAVGCLVDSDGNCTECRAGLEQFCPHVTFTYNSPDVHLGGFTYGGYSDSIVVKDDFCPTRSFQPKSSRSRTTPMRRNYNLLAHATLGCHQR